MNKLIATLFLVLAAASANAQSLRDFKSKNTANAFERTQMLDLLRLDIKNDIEQDVVFVVNYFMVSNEYAWMSGTVQRKDGRPLQMPEYRDCCHVEALFKRVGPNWVLKRNGAFATDVWYLCLADQFPDLDFRIFPFERSMLFCE
jgi:hypothetical protein